MTSTPSCPIRRSANTPGAGRRNHRYGTRSPEPRTKHWSNWRKPACSRCSPQNFDALHEKAGNSPDVIVNLHGTIGTSHCMKCHAKYDTADIMARLDEEPDPHCHRTLPYSGGMPCNGLIKTDVVYFGEALPDGAMEKSYKLASRADELWVIGSTLEVYPAASIVPVAAQAGVPITIMNMGRTQCDRLASRLIRDDIAVALPKLVDETISAAQ